MIVYPVFVGFIKLCYEGCEDLRRGEQKISNLQKHYLPQNSQVRSSK